MGCIGLEGNLAYIVPFGQVDDEADDRLDGRGNDAAGCAAEDRDNCHSVRRGWKTGFLSGWRPSSGVEGFGGELAGVKEWSLLALL